MPSYLWALYKQQFVTYSPTIAMVYDSMTCKRAIMGMESGLPFIALMNTDQMLCVMEVNF